MGPMGVDEGNIYPDAWEGDGGILKPHRPWAL